MSAVGILSHKHWEHSLLGSSRTTYIVHCDGACGSNDPGVNQPPNEARASYVEPNNWSVDGWVIESIMNERAEEALGTHGSVV